MKKSTAKYLSWLAIPVVPAAAFGFLFTRETLPSDAQGAPAPAASISTTLRDAGQAPQTTSVSSPSNAALRRPATETHPAQSRSEQLLQRYNSGSDRRVFAVEAWGRPTEGGRYYAARVARECLMHRQATALAAPRHGTPESAPSISARHHYSEACDGFTEEELSGHFELRADNSERDPLAAAGRSFTAAIRSGSPARRTEAVRQVLEIKDPILIDDLGMRIALYRDEAQGTYVYFEGSRYPVRDDPSILAAFYLLPCGLGLDCAHDAGLQLSCANGGPCHESRLDKVAAETAGGRTGQRFSEILQWYEKLLSAVKRKDASSFVEGS